MALGALKDVFKKGIKIAQAFGGAARRGTRSASTVIGQARTQGMRSASLLERVSYFWNKDVGVKGAKAVGRQATRAARSTASALRRIGRGPGALGHKTLAAFRTPAGKFTTRSLFTVGAASMLGLSVMKGGMDTSRDIVHERYMQDYTYSKSMLKNSRVGLASGTSRMLDRAGTQGLTGALHKTRHGRY